MLSTGNLRRLSWGLMAAVFVVALAYGATADRGPQSDQERAAELASTIALGVADLGPDWLGDPDASAGLVLVPDSELPKGRVFVATREAEAPFAAPSFALDFACEG